MAARQKAATANKTAKNDRNITETGGPVSKSVARAARSPGRCDTGRSDRIFRMPLLRQLLGAQKFAHY
jgi:hypothetical protein